MKILSKTLDIVPIETGIALSGAATVYMSETVRVLNPEGGTLFLDVSGSSPLFDVYLEFRIIGQSNWYARDSQGDYFMVGKDVTSNVVVRLPGSPGVEYRLKFVGKSGNGTDTSIDVHGMGRELGVEAQQVEPSAAYKDSGAFAVSIVGKPYDSIMDANRVAIVNPWHLDEVGPEHVISEENIDASGGAVIQSVAVGFCGYRRASFEFLCSGGVTMTLWATNNDVADPSVDDDWVDVTERVFGTASIVDTHAIGFFDGKVCSFRIRYEVASGSTTNTVDAWVYRGQ